MKTKRGKKVKYKNKLKINKFQYLYNPTEKFSEVNEPYWYRKEPFHE